jgi:hypothetical protein
MNFIENRDPDTAKGAVGPDRPEDDAQGNVAGFKEQLDHRYQDPLNKSSDSGLPGIGQTSEFSMEDKSENMLQQDTGETVRPEDADAAETADVQDQDPGESQRKNQGDKEDDPLAA